MKTLISQQTMTSSVIRHGVCGVLVTWANRIRSHASLKILMEFLGGTELQERRLWVALMAMLLGASAVLELRDSRAEFTTRSTWRLVTSRFYSHNDPKPALIAALRCYHKALSTPEESGEEIEVLRGVRVLVHRAGGELEGRSRI